MIKTSKFRYKNYSSSMLNEIIKYLSTKIFVNADKINDSDEMVTKLKEKFSTATNRDEKIKILSLLPASWPPKKLATEFKTTLYMAKQTKDLVARDGILCGTKKKLGFKRLDNRTVETIQTFYRSDAVSRICPGLRDYKMVDDEGKKQAKQRRLILMNLKELFVEFKRKKMT